MLKFDLKLKFEGVKNRCPNWCLRWPILCAFPAFSLWLFSGPECVHSVAELADKDQIVLCTMGNSVADVVSSVAEFRECWML